MISLRQSTLLVLFLSAQVLFAAKLPPLPSWSAEDKARLEAGEIVVGSALLEKEFTMPDRDQAIAGVEVVIEAVEELPQQAGFEALGENSVIGGLHLLKYFGESPGGYLIDPQRLLSMQERQDFLYGLKVHAEVSKVPVYFYLFDKKQRVPEGYQPEQIYQRLFEDKSKPVVIVYYYMGAPMRTQSALVGGQSEQVPEWHVRELLWNSADKAKEKSDVFDQLDALLGQVSMRLFWVEELLNELVVQLDGIAKKNEAVKQPAKARGRLAGLFKGGAKFQPEWLVIGFASLSALLGGVLWWCRRTYVFPDTPSPARLGGERGGVCGGVLRFSDSQQPPSEQEKRFREDFF